MIDIKDMHPMQINSLKQQLDNEIGLLESSIVDLNNAKNKFAVCTETCGNFDSIENGTSIMVPLTSSLYVPGKVVNNNAFLVDIGTGYFVEKDRKSTVDYFNRKVKFLNEQIEKFAKMLQEKLAIRQSIIEVFQQKAAMMQQQQLQQQQAQKA
ncbi:Prefoldin subunit 5 [Tyrophagus putrescentiae]|nr:Prefoldin subunit 5 [Tyrophagus putrescentiae]